MLTIAILITILGLLVLMLSLRGRVAQRGVFCRRCRFDLAGIDNQSEHAKCPECGRAIVDPGSTRAVRRAKSKGLIVLSSVLLLLGIGLGTVALTGNAASLYRAMPDRVVFLASEWGSDEALDELLARVSDTNNPIDQWVWDDAIEMGLGYQADNTLTWDPRWGEVISLAWQGNKLSEEQKLEFAMNAQRFEYIVRNRMRIDDAYVPNLLKEHSSRGTAINRFQTGYKVRLKDHASGGRFGEETWENTVGGSMSSSFSFLRAGSTGTSTMGGGITVPEHIRSQLSAGDELTVYYEFQFTLERKSDESIIKADPIRFERTVRVVSPGESIVGVVEDPQSAEAIIDGASIEPLTGLVLGSVQHGQYDELASFTLSFSHLTRAISGEVFIQHPTDKERIFVGTVAMDSQPEKLTNWSHGYSLSISMGDETDLIETLKRVTRDGVIDVIFETNPEAAIRNPAIDEVVDLNMHFLAVPVQWFETRGEIYEAQMQNPTIPASAPPED